MKIKPRFILTVLLLISLAFNARQYNQSKTIDLSGFKKQPSVEQQIKDLGTPPPPFKLVGGY